jgi:stage II sporulation protein D
LPHAPAPAAVEGEIGDRPIRVLLRRTTETVLLPQPGRAYRIETSGDARWIHGPIEVTVAGDHAWQVGAYSSPKAAGMVADRLEADLGGDVLVWQEAAGGSLVRVKLRWPDGAPADAERQLAAAGFEDAFRVPVGSVIRIEGDDASVESGDEIVLTPARVWPTSVGGRLYRGRFRLRVAGGDLLFINELDMETYLRGVVPVEMGPYVFPELEALKAQAVAARTYAVAHLGDHDEEGWDICATPACQAYHGASAEHDLSDRAVAETAGLVAVYLGAPIDAMYTSTCGGHTEDAALLFPDRAQPYLTGVACAWDRPLRLAGVGGPGPLMTRESHHAEVARALLGLSATATPGELVREVNELTGVTAHLLASTDVESFSLALLTAAGIDAPTTVTRASSGLDALLGLCDLFGSGLSPPSSGLAGDWPAAATLAVLELSGVVVRDRGEAVPHTDGPAIYPRRAETSEPLPLPLALWERWADGFRRVPDLEVLPGTPLERLRLGDRVVALVAERSGGADEADRRSAWRSWARERDWDELALRLEIPDLERLSVTRRGGSGRVVEMVAQGRSGTVRRLEGFPIRRSLDLPENLFTMFVIRRPDGTRAVRFLGRGWGHGVGLCQNGAYGLARAGMTFDRILAHYYTGVEIGVWDAR